MDQGRDQDKRRIYPKGTRPHGGGIEIRFKWPKGAKDYVHKTVEWKPSPANLERAGKLRQDVVDAIKHGTFRWVDFFPDDPRATSIIVGTFASYGQTWLDSPENDWKPQTRYKWKGILNQVWIPTLHDRPMNSIGHTDLMTALKTAFDAFKARYNREPSKAIYNDWLTCLRGVFDLAIKAGAITRANNPAAELRNKTRDKILPDPFYQDEADAIIADIYKHDGDMWGAWHELGFYSGLRYPSEPAALLWSVIDLRKHEMVINQIRSKHAKDGIQSTTKTGVARAVLLNTRSLHALNVVKKLTKFKGDWVFMQANGTPVITGDPQRAMWRAALSRLKIRYRDAYNMRHTYATIGLMSGANPAFMARQLGHSLEEFFKTYAKWIDRVDNTFQMRLIEAGIGQNVAKSGLANGEKY